jgi:WD40 repeat protein
VAFRVLDAPHLKDDYYCSILAYSYTSRTLAVALTNKVYLWTEEYGVRYPPLPRSRASNFVTSLAFSSDEGGNSILAVARHSGNVTLWSLLEARPRFGAPHPAPASCVAFRPTVAYRQGTNSKSVVPCEDLLVGDDTGRIYYYSLEWSSVESGCMSLLIKLDAHSQNICGLAWTPDGEAFISGGNDNVALLFKVESLLQQPLPEVRSTAVSIGEQPFLPPLNSRSHNALASLSPTPPTSPERPYIAGVHPMVSIFELPQRAASRNGMDSPPTSPTFSDRSGREPIRGAYATRERTRGRKTSPILNNDLANPRIVGHINMHAFSFHHSAAVKAIAFAPWQPTLLATGGGSNDRQIHFHHTGSGATLAVINVFAQVTSLIWSTTRREIVATFGYAQPEHDIRIAVFSWPSCECVVSIPWERKLNGEIGRALWAIPYPGGPNDAVPTRTQTNEGFAAWEAVRLREEQRRRVEVPAAADARAANQIIPEDRGRSMARARNPQSTEGSRRGRHQHQSPSRSRVRSRLRGEGETWASRTEEEGSLIIACCDQTVKFFEVWAGKSKGRGLGLGSKEGVLGGSRVLEGWCEGVDGLEVGREDIIR